MNNEISKRILDDDMEAAFENSNPDEFKLEDIDNILAEIAGENDEYSWYWIVVLKDGRYALIEAACDYIGWDCQSWINLYTGKSIDEVLEFAPEKEDWTKRIIRSQLKNQVLGLQPFGLYIEPVYEDRR